MNLLESAGFSRSNPYYVVQQGKVWSLFFSYLCMYCFLIWLTLLDCLIDSVINTNERFRTAGSTERNWWYTSLWRKTSWKSENYARNWQVVTIELVASCLECILSFLQIFFLNQVIRGTRLSKLFNTWMRD